MEEMHNLWRERLREMIGDDNIFGIEIGSTIRMLANCYETAINQKDENSELSGPRMAILIRLVGEEKFGNPNGINPTQISRLQNVSKNTISALLRGLEDQGLIERRIDPLDKRRFLIRITPAGRDLVKKSGPSRIQFMNQLASNLDDTEKEQLLSLLGKLRMSLLAYACPAHSNSENDVDAGLHR